MDKKELKELIDMTPTDLELVGSNEKGGFILFKSKKEGTLFSVARLETGGIVLEELLLPMQPKE